MFLLVGITLNLVWQTSYTYNNLDQHTRQFFSTLSKLHQITTTGCHYTCHQCIVRIFLHPTQNSRHKCNEPTAVYPPLYQCIQYIPSFSYNTNELKLYHPAHSRPTHSSNSSMPILQQSIKLTAPCPSTSCTRSIVYLFSSRNQFKNKAIRQLFHLSSNQNIQHTPCYFSVPMH